MLTHEKLLQLVRYDPKTGLFERVKRRTNALAIAGSKRDGGYVGLYLDGRSYVAHRVAWLYMTGKWPEDQIDHIDGDRENNRFANLREATNAQNLQNRAEPYANNASSGVLGVYWHRQAKRWQARIQVNGKARSLGLYEEKEAARAAYLRAKAELHPFAPVCRGEAVERQSARCG